MAKGEYCARHDQWFGDVLPCRLCDDEFRVAWAAEHLRAVTYEEWLKANAGQPSPERT